jgi:hypothetical protein
MDIRDGDCAELEVISEQDEFLLLVLIPHHDPAKEIRAVFLGVDPKY